MKRIEFIKGITLTPFINIKKEETIEEYLIKKGFEEKSYSLHGKNKTLFKVKNYLRDQIVIGLRKENFNEMVIYTTFSQELPRHVYYEGNIPTLEEFKILEKLLEI